MPSQSVFSTIWKPGSALSKPIQIEQRDDEGDDRRQQRDHADVAARALALVADEQDQQHADQRQEGDRRQDGPIGHQKLLPNIIQVTSAATPISMAKA